MSSASSVDLEITQYLDYSVELLNSIPIVAYYCKLHAFNLRLQLIKQDKANLVENVKYITLELKVLENMKNTLP